MAPKNTSNFYSLRVTVLQLKDKSSTKKQVKKTVEPGIKEVLLRALQWLSNAEMAKKKQTAFKTEHDTFMKMCVIAGYWHPWLMGLFQSFLHA